MKNLQYIHQHLATLLEQQMYEKVLTSVVSFPDFEKDIALLYIKLYCELELNRIEQALVTIKTACKKHPKNTLLKQLKNQLKDEVINPNPLSDTIDQFIDFYTNLEALPKGKEFDKFLDFIINKPFIK